MLKLSVQSGEGQVRGIAHANPYNAAIVALSPFHLSVTGC